MDELEQLRADNAQLRAEIREAWKWVDLGQEHENNCDECNGKAYYFWNHAGESGCEQKHEPDCKLAAWLERNKPEE